VKLSPAQRKVLDAMAENKGVYRQGRFYVGNSVYHTPTLNRLFGAKYIAYAIGEYARLEAHITDAGREALEQ